MSGSYMRCSWEPKYLAEGVPGSSLKLLPQPVHTLEASHQV